VGSRSADLRYLPYGALFGAPSVVVDGSPAPGTVLCLSHWPGIASPPEFFADLSAEMAFAYLDAFDRHGEAAVVSNNHFDQDGLVGLFALVAPTEALPRRELLIEVARAGDFAVTASRRAARISMALSAFADPERTPLHRLPAEYDAQTAELYRHLLERLPDVCDRPERYRDLWGDEDATLRASGALLASGAVTIAERPDVDLAVVSVSGDAPAGGGHRFAGQWVSGLHPMALHNATERGALLTVQGRHYQLTYRYESWVRYRTRAVRPRVDLAPLAEQLNAEEAAAGGTATWVAERVSALTPVLSLADPDADESRLAPEAVLSAIATHLRDAPPAWDPFRITC
jgi:hypothetical protein